MGAKILEFDQAAREKIRAGVQKLARAVKVTFGPKGRNAVIDKGWGSPTITKDGVTVAEEIDLKDPYENMGAQLVKEAASKTSDVAGDGTTTSTVLAEAIFLEAYKYAASGANVTELNRGVKQACDAVVAALKGMSKQVASDKKAIQQVASIAANGDAEVGKHDRRGDGQGRQGRRDHGRGGQDPRDDRRGHPGHAVRPRLPLAALRDRSRAHGVRAREAVHPHLGGQDLGRDASSCRCSSASRRRAARSS